jgi:uncharacterized protein
MAVSEITSLRIYPIKSCCGISIPSTTLTKQGLALDRRWMFVDAANKFITIRQKPQMTLINASIDNDTEELIITIGTDVSKQVRVPLYPSEAWLSQNTAPVTVEIWEQHTAAHAYTDPAIASIFRDFIGEGAPVTLVMKDASQPRVCGGNGAPQLLGREATVNFPDVLPVQIASESSIAELNSRLKSQGEEEITIERFRPNIIVSSPDLVAWSEDRWKTVRINGDSTWLSTLRGANREAIDVDICARCARCQVPNVDPDSAVKHKKQPWDTLMKYRRVDEGIKFKPCFGMLGCPRGAGEVKVGMRVEVTGWTDSHRYVKGF